MTYYHPASETQRTAASSPGTLYRGLAAPFSEAQMEDVMEAYGKESFVGRVLGYLSKGFFTPNREWGLGKHWTTNINVAKSFSQNGFGTPVVLVAEWDGRGEDPYNAPGNNFGGEDEVTLLPGTELRLVDILWGANFESIGGAGRTITAGGDLPPGLRLEHPKPNQVVAYDDDNPDPWLSRFGVGVLSWDDDGVISWVAIQDDAYKRRGVATAMLEYARTIRHDIRHSDELSESGAGWAQAVGSRTAGTRTDPGGVYRGINVQVLNHDEQEEVAAWANGNSFSLYDYQLAEPNYELVYRILDRLDSGGLGRHWSKDYDVSASFARDQGDGIELILIGHWEGEGVDQREFHRGWDGVQRPSNLPHEEEVTLYPGTPVTLVGMDIVTETGFTYNIPVPNIQVTAGHDMKHLANRTAASDLRVHLFDSEGHEMWLEPDFDGNPWTYHPKVMDAVRFLADVAQSSGVYWHMDHNEWIPSTITDFKVYDGSNDVTHEIKGFPQLRGHYASRTAYVSDDIYESYYDTDRLVYLVMNVNVWGADQPLWELVANSYEEAQAFFDSLDEDERRWNVAEVLENGGWTMSAIGRKFSTRTAAEPGGVLPWTPSHRGYTWITKTDGTLEAVTNDGVNRMFLHEYPYGWEWEVFDSLGFVEGGTFGMALKGGDALRDRANDLLSEFDSRAERRTRGPSRGYQDDYTQAPNTLWSKRATTSQRYAERLRREGRR